MCKTSSELFLYHRFILLVLRGKLSPPPMPDYTVGGFFVTVTFSAHIL